MASGQPRVENGHRPELNHVSKMSGSWRSSAAGRPQASQARRAVRLGRDRHVAVGAVPGRDPMAPPQLARHVPVADVREPVLPGLLEALRKDARTARTGRLERPLGQRRRPDEPLGLEARLEHVVAALAAPDDHLVRPLSREVAASLEVGHDPAPRFVPVEAVVGGAAVGDRRVVGQDRRSGQVVAHARGMVVLIVRRGDLHGPGPERPVHDVVGDDRDVALDERDPDAPPDQGRVASDRRDGPRQPCRRGSSPDGSWPR